MFDHGGTTLICAALLSGDKSLLEWAVDISVKAHEVAEKVIQERSNQSIGS